MANTRYVIRNNYSSAYVHKTLFCIRAFTTKYHALWYMRRNGLNENYFEAVRVDERLSA